MKDETDTVIKRFRKRSKKSPEKNACEQLSSSSASPAPTDAEHANGFTVISNPGRATQYADKDDSTEWYAISRVRMTPFYERNQVALFCCRETINLKTLSWIMSDEKWIELLPEMMARSETLTSVIHANAANYLAKMRGAKTIPKQALTHYAYALRELQGDLYDPVRQKSDETLFAIILLGIFDVCTIFNSLMCSCTIMQT